MSPERQLEVTKIRSPNSSTLIHLSYLQFYFETEIYHVARASLEFATILLPQPPNS